MFKLNKIRQMYLDFTFTKYIQYILPVHLMWILAYCEMKGKKSDCISLVLASIMMKKIKEHFSQLSQDAGLLEDL